MTLYYCPCACGKLLTEYEMLALLRSTETDVTQMTVNDRRRAQWAS